MQSMIPSTHRTTTTPPAAATTVGGIPPHSTFPSAPFSLPVRLTTISVCSPSNNYGVQYTGGDSTDGPGQVGLGLSFPVYSSGTTNAGCCAQCYSVPGCVLYYLDCSSQCTLYVTNAGSAPDESAQCLNGIVGESPGGPGSAYGISAACAVLV